MTWQNSTELRERAFAFLSGASECRTIDELHARFAQLAQAYGFRSVGFIRLMQVGGPLEPQVIFGQAPGEWLERYVAQDYGRIDPTIPLAFQSREAITWEAAEERNRSKEARAFFGEARELFAQDSFIVPVWGPCGELSVVNLLSDHPLDMPQEERTMLQGLCSLYATLGLAMIEPGLPPATEATRALGRRELQCLYWMSMGKHDQEIAVILGISPLTVRTYVDSAREKLGVASRPALIRKAVTLGLLLPERSTLRQ
jgi:DNA-binding CsgD family transcriptional regulator